ncbi:MAG: M23 family metallopeptidase [Oscillospiraceae bacterium]
MKKMSNGSSKFKQIFSGKGFYIALCASIVTVGAVGIIAYNQTSEKLKSQLEEKIPIVTTTPDEYDYDSYVDDANAPEDDIPKETVAENEMEIIDEPVKKVATQPNVMPLNGEIFNAFSNGQLVKSKTLDNWKTHDGADIGGALGDQVKSMTGGKVVDVKEDALWGVCVIIDHGNGLEGHYYNLNKIVPVKVGQKVSAGTVIGAIGDTAQCEVAEVSHLHFGLKKDGKWIDPVAFIQGN